MFQTWSIISLYQPVTTLRCYQLFVKQLARGKDIDFWGSREDAMVIARIHSVPGHICSSINKWYLYHVWSFGNSLHWCKKQWILMKGYFFMGLERNRVGLLEMKVSKLSTLVETLTFPNITFDHIDTEAILKWMQQLTLL